MVWTVWNGGSRASSPSLTLGKQGWRGEGRGGSIVRADVGAAISAVRVVVKGLNVTEDAPAVRARWRMATAGAHSDVGVCRGVESTGKPSCLI